MPAPQLILASTSVFRKSILDKLQFPFITMVPNCDETALPDETPQKLVERLAVEKAKSCQADLPALIIGSDQVCVINNYIVGKPHTREKAIEQLLAASGQVITFYTGLALYNTETDKAQVLTEAFNVHFRNLTRAQIENYVDREQPLKCAGSFKSEGLGIALFKKLEGKDPNTLVGLPLISLVEMLEHEGVDVLGDEFLVART